MIPCSGRGFQVLLRKKCNSRAIMRFYFGLNKGDCKDDEVCGEVVSRDYGKGQCG